MRRSVARVPGAAWRQHANYYFFVQTDVDLHRWYEVGLAAWFAAHTVSGTRIRYTPNSARIRNLRSSVQRGNYVGLEEFVTLGQNEFDARFAEHEAQAYALVDFLQRGPDAADGFDPAWAGILDTYRSTALQRRSPRGALAAAIGQIDLVALEAAWVKWVKAGLK